MNSTPRTSPGIFARLFAAGRALRGQPPAKQLARTAVGDFTPMLWAGRRMTPDQVRWVLESAIGGNIHQQWALFDLMEETWPRLTKNLSEVRRAAARLTYSVQPYAEGEKEPTESARDRARLVECAIANWRPKPGTLELSFEDALFNALDALGKGLSVLELTWQRAEEGLMPRCAHLLPPQAYGWNQEGTELGLVAAAGGESQISNFRSQSRSTWSEFPPGQFWVGVWHSRSGAPGQTALLRCLAPYWCGIVFGWEWLLNNAQIFGVPLRWATYEEGDAATFAKLQEMLANLGSAGWAAFPAGTTMEFKEAVQRASDNPQVFVQTLADKYCDQLILGQEASSESKPAGIGNGASELHGSVRADRLQDAAQWCADLLNYQLVPALLRWNWGDESEPPEIVPELAGEPDPKAKAERDDIILKSAEVPKKWFFKRHGIPLPKDGEETVGGASQAQPGSSEITAPGRSVGADAPATDDDPEKSNLRPGSENRGGNPQNEPARARFNSPDFAGHPGDALKAADAAKKPTLSGDYQLPEAAQRRLAAARAADFEPLRKAAEPLLKAMERGDLEVVGELEAFIAHLDAVAAKVAGAGELADALEKALAEAAIQGAAGTYSKLNDTKK